MRTTFTRGSVPTVPLPSAVTLATAVRRALARVDAALVVARERRDLASLDDRLLRDIGLDRATARREAARDFLDVPPERLPKL